METFQVQSSLGMNVQIISAGSALDAVTQYLKTFAVQPKEYRWVLMDDGFHIIVSFNY